MKRTTINLIAGELNAVRMRQLELAALYRQQYNERGPRWAGKLKDAERCEREAKNYTAALEDLKTTYPHAL